MTRPSNRIRSAAFLAACSATIAGCGGPAPAAQPTDTAPVLVAPENLYVAKTETLEAGPALTGTLVAEREATLRAELGGTLTSVSVDQGERVDRGQLLARITDDGVRDQVQSARSAVRTATEALTVARRNAERSETLAKAGALSARDLEQDRWAVTSAEASLAEATARLANAEQQLEYTRIRSPLRGVVTERHVGAGDVVSQGTPLFTVIDPSRLELEAQVPVSALGSLSIGTPVTFTVDGLGDASFTGRISRVNAALDPATRQVRVTVALPNQGGRLVAGLYAQGRAAVESHTGVVVPLSAIDRRGLRPTVTRIRGGAAEQVAVTFGIEDPEADRVEIATGLAVGDTVLTGSARGIQPGTRIKAAAAAERISAARD